LEILIVEDNPVHIEQAQRTFIQGNSEATFDFATTLEEARKRMAEKRYDGVISDIFFPADQEQREGYVQGYDLAAAREVERILNQRGVRTRRATPEEVDHHYEIIFKKLCEENPAGQTDPTVAQYLKEEARNQAELACELSDRLKQFGITEDGPWFLKGDEQAPLGMIVVQEAQAQGIPVIYCTDTNHHGKKTQLIYEYGGAGIIDTFYQDIDAEAPFKHLELAYRHLRAEILGEIVRAEE
jgi:CheY-like chemotaxis protein